MHSQQAKAQGKRRREESFLHMLIATLNRVLALEKVGLKNIEINK